MHQRIKKSLLLSSAIFVAAFGALALFPHTTCGCGQYEDGSQLTHYINTVSEAITGKPLIEKNPSPFK